MSKTASGLPATVVRRPTAAATPPEVKWEEAGRRIWQTVNRSAWELGDWWAFGEDQGYGQRKEIAERIGFSFQTCANAASVARAFESSRRREVLSWGHHEAVASLPPSEADSWLDKAESDGLSVMALRDARRSLPVEKRPALPAGTFDVLLADPPWRYDDATPNRRVENHYPTMKVEQIAAVPIPVAPNAVLFLWATAPKLREALQVMEAWGFEYRTNLVWVKDKIGMGYYARGRHELLLVGRRGDPGLPAESERPDSVFEAPRLQHSAKPDIVYDLVETMYPDRAYLELFARSERDGWTSWGNEL